MVQYIQVIDSHTGGEPTRVIVGGGPDLGRGSMIERRAIFRERFDHIRSATINEPRGSDVVVGAILVEPTDPSCVSGVIYFNNASYLNMCGHGTIGVAVTLAHLGRIGPGKHKLETPVGIVGIEYYGDNRATIENVPSYRLHKRVSVPVEGYGNVSGDVAYGGNWFFLVGEHALVVELNNLDRLFEFTKRIRDALPKHGITGADGAEIDHIEIFGPPRDKANHSRNFVLCPGLAYDRSPCGTGTSAKLACLVADGKLREGEFWRQESIIGSLFEGSVRLDGDKIYPRITGTAYVNAEATLILNPADPFCMGIR
jgi:4-hydroxyproline epimerase